MSASPEEKGSRIGIENEDGILRLNLPRGWSRKLFGLEQKRIRTGYKATDEDRRLLERTVIVMEEDYLRGIFDISLEKYNLRRASTIKKDISDTKITSITLLEGYDQYCNHRKPHLAPSTYEGTYRQKYLRIMRKIALLPTGEVYDWVVSNKPIRFARGFLSMLEKLGNYLVRKCISPYGERNPFIGFSEDSKHIKPRISQSQEEELNSLSDLSLLNNLNLLGELNFPQELGLLEEFDPEEFEDCRAYLADDVEKIVEAFLQSRYAYLAPIIIFLFLTGCRPSEACELRWKDIFINPITKRCIIKIHRSYSSISGQIQFTKTYRKRIFPVVDLSIVEVFLKLKPNDVDPNDLIFKTPKGERINMTQVSQIWGATNYNGKPGIVRQLANEKKISTYLKLYATRHTFITLQIRAQGHDIVIDLAGWVGSSSATIYRHYINSRRGSTPAFIYKLVF